VRSCSILGQVRWCVFKVKKINYRGHLGGSLTKVSYMMHYFVLTVNCECKP